MLVDELPLQAVKPLADAVNSEDAGAQRATGEARSHEPRADRNGDVADQQ